MSRKKLPPPAKRCQYKTRSGKRCKAARLHDSEFCFFHDPIAQEGSWDLTRLEHLQLGKPSTIHQLLAETVEAVRQEKLNPQQAYAVGWLVQLMMQNLTGIEREAAGYERRSYGRIWAGKVREVLYGGTEEDAEKEKEAELEETAVEPEDSKEPA